MPSSGDKASAPPPQEQKKSPHKPRKFTVARRTIASEVQAAWNRRHPENPISTEIAPIERPPMIRVKFTEGGRRRALSFRVQVCTKNTTGRILKCLEVKLRRQEAPGPVGPVGTGRERRERSQSAERAGSVQSSPPS